MSKQTRQQPVAIPPPSVKSSAAATAPAPVSPPATGAAKPFSFAAAAAKGATTATAAPAAPAAAAPAPAMAARSARLGAPVSPQSAAPAGGGFPGGTGRFRFGPNGVAGDEPLRATFSAVPARPRAAASWLDGGDAPLADGAGRGDHAGGDPAGGWRQRSDGAPQQHRGHYYHAHGRGGGMAGVAGSGSGGPFSGGSEELSETALDQNRFVRANLVPPFAHVVEVDTETGRETALAAPESGSGAGDDAVRVPAAGPDGRHALRFEWGLWHMYRPPNRRVNYEQSLKQLSTFGDVETFWDLYAHLRPLRTCPTVTEFHLFKAGTRGMWEDHPDGGKWILRLRRGYGPRCWENLMLALIGDQFDMPGGTDEIPEVYGAVMSLRGNEEIISVWNLSASSHNTNLKIRDTIKRVLGLPSSCLLEYKAHRQALEDQSSFRNTDTFR